MDKVIGRVRKFGDNLDTDTAAPGPYLLLPMKEVVKHAFEPVYPEFYKSVKPGDIIVGAFPTDRVIVVVQPFRLVGHAAEVQGGHRALRNGDAIRGLADQACRS